MDTEPTRPADIERRSMEIIEAELGPTPWLGPSERAVLKRVIHATADFDYRESLTFSGGSVDSALAALSAGTVIVTDTNMALAGISKPALAALGCEAVCFMADPRVSAKAKADGVTRAEAAMNMAAELYGRKNAIFAIGNAPTALLRLCALAEKGAIVPALIIGAPVGFVNVTRSKERLAALTAPHIAAMGRKGGSAVAAAICNAMLYMLYDRGRSLA